MKMSLYSEQDAEELKKYVKSIPNEFDKILIAMKFSSVLRKTKAKEYLNQGFNRRLKTLSKCICAIFKLTEPNSTVKPTDNELYDVYIYLQSFYINVYGCLDNLARIWVEELQIKNASGKQIRKFEINLWKKNSVVWNTLSTEMQKLIESRETWINFIIDFRDATAHRIPIYVPPFALSKREEDMYNNLETEMQHSLMKNNIEAYELAKEKQSKIGKFMPIARHSFTESNSQILYHSQILVDWDTILELMNQMITDLEAKYAATN